MPSSKELWPRAVKALDFSLRYWDKDGDAVPDAQQHVDYDIEFYGPNPLGAICLLGALKAAVEVLPGTCGDPRAGEAVSGDPGARSGVRGFPYVERRVLRASACGTWMPTSTRSVRAAFSDQLIGQFMAFVCGLGHLLPQEHVREAARSIYTYNFRHVLP